MASRIATMHNRKEIICEQCGTAFPPKTVWQRFCSPRCHDDYWVKIRRIASAMNKHGMI